MGFNRSVVREQQKFSTKSFSTEWDDRLGLCVSHSLRKGSVCTWRCVCAHVCTCVLGRGTSVDNESSSGGRGPRSVELRTCSGLAGSPRACLSFQAEDEPGTF